MSRATTENGKNISTNFVAAMFENDIGPEKVSREKVLANFGHFGASKADYSMEKVNFPENTVLRESILFVHQKKQKDLLLGIFHDWTNRRGFKSSPGCLLLDAKRE